MCKKLNVLCLTLATVAAFSVLASADPIVDSNMPAGLAALVAAEGGRASMMAPAKDNNDYLGGADYCVSFYATTNSDGAITIYGWIDPTDFIGSMHLPLNGFEIDRVISLMVDGDNTVTPQEEWQLKVDIDGGGASTPKVGWYQWGPFASTWASPVSTTFDMGGLPWENPIAELSTYRKNQDPTGALSASRDRSGGWAGVLGTGDFSAGTKGFGTNYVKLTLTQLQPETQYRVYLWSFEARQLWSADACNPNSKYAVWSTTNPKDWLDIHGYSGDNGEPNGYGPLVVFYPMPKGGCCDKKATTPTCDWLTQEDCTRNYPSRVWWEGIDCSHCYPESWGGCCDTERILRYNEQRRELQRLRWRWLGGEVEVVWRRL